MNYTKISKQEFEEIRATHKHITPADGNQLTAHLTGMHWRKQLPVDGQGPVLFWQWRKEWPDCVYFKSVEIEESTQRSLSNDTDTDIHAE